VLVRVESVRIWNRGARGALRYSLLDLKALLSDAGGNEATLRIDRLSK